MTIKGRFFGGGGVVRPLPLKRVVEGRRAEGQDSLSLGPRNLRNWKKTYPSPKII
jgi:hypothetical protein